jgi:Dickkopf N-terminal cysteine-rich region
MAGFFGPLVGMLVAAACNRESSDAPSASGPAGLAAMTEEPVALTGVPSANPGVSFRALGKRLYPRLEGATIAKASVRLPLVASDSFEVATSQNPDFAIQVYTVGTEASAGPKGAHAAAPAQVDSGLVRYPSALGPGTEIMHRVTSGGTEDYATFSHAPSRAQLDYRVTLGKAIAGLRKVGDVVEFLDAGGAPRLRVDAPYGVDAKGERFAAHLAIANCKFDENPAPPWGRAVRAPENTACTLSVTWNESVAYPATIDPGWSAGADMANTNISHEMLMAKLTGGKVLVTNATAQIFDPNTGTWATTANPTLVTHRSRLIATDGDTALIISPYTGDYIGLYSLATGLWTAATLPDALDEGGASATNLGGNNVLIVEGNGRTRVYDRVANTFTAKTTGPALAGNLAAFPLPGTTKIAFNGYGSQTLRVYDTMANSWSAPTAALAGDPNCGSLEPLSDGTVLSYSQDGIAAVLNLTTGARTLIANPPAALKTTYLCARTAQVPYGTKKHYLAGGRISYDETTGALTDLGAFPSGALFHGAIVQLDDGRFLAAGGNASLAAYRSVDLYGPVSAADCVAINPGKPLFNPNSATCSACDGDNGTGTASQCPDPLKPACQTGALLGQCTQCSAATNANCTGTTPLCDLTLGACAKCDGGFGSGSALACNVASFPVCGADGSCVKANGDKGTTATAPCPTSANPVVNTDGSCGKCMDNTKCVGAAHAGPICNIATGICGATCTTNVDCSFAQYCDTANSICAAKKDSGATCDSSSECVSLSCSGSKCDKLCLTQAECGKGNYCDVNASKKTCKVQKPAGGDCAVGFECTSGACSNMLCEAVVTDAGAPDSSADAAFDGGMDAGVGDAAPDAAPKPSSSSSGGSSSSGAASSSGGSTSSSSGASGAVAPTPAAPAESSGCGCSAASGGDAGVGSVAIALGALVLRRRIRSSKDAKQGQ